MKWVRLVAVGVLSVSSAGLTAAQTYSYNYTSIDPSNTSGSFTVSGAPGAYSLSSFQGSIGGVNYDTSQVGIRQGSGTSAIYLGGLVNGIDTPFSGSNDFEQVHVFNPGVGAFSDVFSYTKIGSQASGISISAVLTNPPTYNYSFTSSNPSNTSGSFAITGGPGAYSLSAFAGTVGGVTYTTSMVGIRQGSNTSAIYLGGLVNGIDTPFSGSNDFEQVHVFNPGVGVFSDVFSYTKVGSQASGISVKAILTNPSTYYYSFTSADPKNTSGSFAITGGPGAYSLTDFAGTIGGVKYDTSMVGINEGSGTSAIYLGGLVNGVDTPISGTNDFEQVNVFNPGDGVFSDYFSYVKPGSNASGVSVQFALERVSTQNSSAPEPASWALMLSGFGLIGFAMRNRRDPSWWFA